MPNLPNVTTMGLWHLPDDAAKAEALLDAADKVDVHPTVAEVEAFFDQLENFWRCNMAQTNALMRVIGIPAGAGYAGGFLHNAGPLRFTNFSRELVALQLICRIADFNRIRQKSHPLCGPVTLIQDIASRDPVAYVDYVIGLAENGQGDLNGKPVHIAPGANILGKHPHHASIHEADYIALASLRQADGRLPYRAWYTNRTLQGATMPSKLVEWMTQSGYTNVQNHTHAGWKAAGILVHSHRESFATNRMRQSLNAMHGTIAAGDTVIMLAAGNLAHEILDDNRRDSKFVTIFGSHFMIVRGVNILGNGVSFDIVTWGRASAVPLKEISWSKIGSWYQGYISGTP